MKMGLFLGWFKRCSVRREAAGTGLGNAVCDLIAKYYLSHRWVLGTMTCHNRDELKRNGVTGELFAAKDKPHGWKQPAEGELDALISWFDQHLLK